MTDITRLLASLKRRSAHAKEFGDSITFVKLEDIDALVEALEKAQAQSSKWLEAYHKAVSIGARYEERIAELEGAEQKLCAANVTLDARAELAEPRLAELESSHAKLRDAMAAIHNTIRIDGAYTPLAAILNATKRAYEESASTAGIELDVQPAQPCEHSMFWDASGVKRCSKCDSAELESRTVTVKLPERYACDLGYNSPDPNGDILDLDDVLAMLSAAGIKWEAE